MMFRFAIALALLISPALGAEPEFIDYPAEIYTGKIHKPILDTADKREYRTRINNAAKGEPNFAGHFILAGWGCGAVCIFGAVINAKTGEVSFLPAAVCCWDEAEGLQFYADSRLIVFNGMLNEEEPKAAHYFEYDGTAFRPVNE